VEPDNMPTRRVMPLKGRETSREEATIASHSASADGHEDRGGTREGL
jgi:hypothetical protein